MVRQHHPRLYVACSFQKEASVIVDMLVRIEPEARFLVLDTGVPFDATYETWRRMEDRHGKWKAPPPADWTERDVWRHIAEHDVPYNPLHDQGFASIGCVPCTVPGAGREGRWAGTDRIECGLHLPVR